MIFITSVVFVLAQLVSAIEFPAPLPSYSSSSSSLSRRHCGRHRRPVRPNVPCFSSSSSEPCHYPEPHRRPHHHHNNCKPVSCDSSSSSISCERPCPRPIHHRHVEELTHHYESGKHTTIITVHAHDQEACKKNHLTIWDNGKEIYGRHKKRDKIYLRSGKHATLMKVEGQEKLAISSSTIDPKCPKNWKGLCFSFGHLYDVCFCDRPSKLRKH